MVLLPKLSLKTNKKWKEKGRTKWNWQQRGAITI